MSCLVQVLTWLPWLQVRSAVFLKHWKIVFKLICYLLASNNCFSHRNVFQNGVKTLTKCLTIFLSKSSRFCTFRAIRFSSNFTSMWFKYLSNNVWRDFRCQHQLCNIRYPIVKSIFFGTFVIKTLPCYRC